MANICSIEILIPLDKVPDEKEREQLKALYEAEKKWNEAVKGDDELRRGINRDTFLASQPGVPFKRTKWEYNFFDDEVKNGLAKEGDLKPDSEQYNTPTIYASFEERNGRTWVHPVTFGRSEGLLFDENDGISFRMPKPTKKNKFYLGSFTYIPMSWDFKWSFPWWAEIGFAGGKKECDEKGEDPSKGQSDEFYKKWYEEHEQPFPYLVWEISMSQLLKNLEYAIKVYEHFPVIGETWQMVWIWKELTELKNLYRWIKKVYFALPEAIAQLDWAEVAMNSGEYEWTQKNDSPNQIMASVKRMEIDVQQLNSGKLSQEAFKKKYVLHLRGSRKDYKGYIPIVKRDPFDYYEWIK